jgi:hypothetical protein
MKIKVMSRIYGVDGITPLPEKVKDGKDVGELTLKDVILNSILSTSEGDDEEKKFKRYEIYKKFKGVKTEVDLTIDELATIRKSIGKFQSPLVMGQCFDLLEKAKE